MLNDKGQTTNPDPAQSAARPYDMEERTALFGEQIVKFANRLEKTLVSRPLIGQLVRSATSIGANYMEADAAESHKDFHHKLAISKKEARETLHWLRMIAAACPAHEVECREFWGEALQLIKILSAMIIKGSSKLDEQGDKHD